MIVNICCSGSSGSTFFSNLMNRHPEIVCGDELGLFSKPVFYDNYEHLKRWHFLIKRTGISSYPYFAGSICFEELAVLFPDKGTSVELGFEIKQHS